MIKDQYKTFARLLTMLRQNSTDSRIGLLSVECFLYVAQESQTIAQLAQKTGADAASVNKAIYPFIPKLDKEGYIIQPRIGLLKRKKINNQRSRHIMLSKLGVKLLELSTCDE
tara:strand:+ start:390 stop:728 length:339 start_codon:yes stop_codon:yes gene_type:complete